MNDKHYTKAEEIIKNITTRVLKKGNALQLRETSPYGGYDYLIIKGRDGLLHQFIRESNTEETIWKEEMRTDSMAVIGIYLANVTTKYTEFTEIEIDEVDQYELELM